MAGPDPAVAEVRRAVRSALADSDRSVFVACSGGPDSLALAAAVAFETRCRSADRVVGLVTIDHQLQPGSGEQARRVTVLAYELGLDPVLLLPVDATGFGGPEAAARSARYTALDDVAARHDADILLGHTLDDQAETVLLGLGRGSGPRSIAGMPAQRGPYRRPLLGVRRATTVRACAALGLEPWLDPQNADERYQRVRLRRLLPELEAALQGGVAEALARTADLLADDLAALDELALTALASVQQTPDELDARALAEYPKAVRTRVLRLWSQAATGSLSAGQTAALDALLSGWRGQGAVDLPGGCSVVRVSGRLVLHRPPSRLRKE